MSVADLRTQLTNLAAQLPVSHLSAAYRNAEDSRATLVIAWRGSDHPSAQAAQAAASAAVGRIAELVAVLEQVTEDIAYYNETL
ncbi:MULTISPECIES: hypothetical protein [Pseudonocardiaceae]|uniref:Uncharacterized protein n=1 Tax=Prauserella endophytica TaxID=1592324 RepID=A0ABY2RSG8_9PSEU|nr:MULTISPECIES: hypothetical protein [Pseudonocardiaceae]TKG58451.1 hypothetical protein FCN18_37860 [Prauserella endophytica]